MDGHASKPRAARHTLVDALAAECIEHLHCLTGPGGDAAMLEAVAQNVDALARTVGDNGAQRLHIQEAWRWLCYALEVDHPNWAWYRDEMVQALRELR